MCTAPTSAIAGEATSSATWTGSPAKVGVPRSAEGRAPPPLFRLVGGVGFFFPPNEIYLDTKKPLRVRFRK